MVAPSAFRFHYSSPIYLELTVNHCSGTMHLISLVASSLLFQGYAQLHHVFHACSTYLEQLDTVHSLRSEPHWAGPHWAIHPWIGDSLSQRVPNLNRQMTKNGGSWIFSFLTNWGARCSVMKSAAESLCNFQYFCHSLLIPFWMPWFETVLEWRWVGALQLECLSLKGLQVESCIQKPSERHQMRVLVACGSCSSRLSANIPYGSCVVHNSAETRFDIIIISTVFVFLLTPN